MNALNFTRLARVSVIGLSGLILAACDLASGSSGGSASYQPISMRQSAGDHGTVTVSSTQGGASGADKVRVCLTNNTNRDKGMHWRTGEIPRYIAEPGVRVCDNHPPRDNIIWHLSRKTRAVLGVGAYWRQTVPVALNYADQAGNTVEIVWSN